jgi:hypothetical protein
MNQETTLTEKESLEVISTMIQTAKATFTENGFLYLFWGWLVFLAALLHFILLRADFAYPFIGWALMPFAGIFTALYVRRDNREKKVRTYIDEFLGYLWSAAGVYLFMLLAFMYKLSPELAYPLIIMIYGLSTYVSGAP